MTADERIVPEWVMRAIDYPACDICGQPVASGRNVHTICSLAYSQATDSVPTVYVLGVDKDES